MDKYFIILISFFRFVKSVLYLFGYDFHFSVKKSKNYDPETGKRKKLVSKGTPSKASSKNAKKDTKATSSSSSKQSPEKDKVKKMKKKNRPLYVKKYKKNLEKHKAQILQLKKKMDSERYHTGKVLEQTVAKYKMKISEGFTKRSEKPFILPAQKQKNFRKHQCPSYKRRNKVRTYLTDYHQTFFKAEKPKNRTPMTSKALVEGFDAFDNSWFIKDKENIQDMLKKIYHIDLNPSEYGHFAEKRKNPYLCYYDIRPLLKELKSFDEKKQRLYVHRLGNFVLFGTVKKMMEAKSRTGH